MVQKIHPRGVRSQVFPPRLVTCQKKNDNLAVQYEDCPCLSLCLCTRNNVIQKDSKTTSKCPFEIGS